MHKTISCTTSKANIYMWLRETHHKHWTTKRHGTHKQTAKSRQNKEKHFSSGVLDILHRKLLEITNHLGNNIKLRGNKKTFTETDQMLSNRGAITVQHDNVKGKENMLSLSSLTIQNQRETHGWMDNQRMLRGTQEKI